MSGRASICPLDISDHSSQVNRGDPFFNDLWGRGYEFSEDWIPNVKDYLIHSKQQWQPTRKEPGPSWGTERKLYGSISVLLAKTQASVWLWCEVKTVEPGDLVLRKMVGTLKKPSMGEVKAQLGGPYRITSVAGTCATCHIHGWEVHCLGEEATRLDNKATLVAYCQKRYYYWEKALERG